MAMGSSPEVDRDWQGCHRLAEAEQHIEAAWRIEWERRLAVKRSTLIGESHVSTHTASLSMGQLERIQSGS